MTIQRLRKRLLKKVRLNRIREEDALPLVRVIGTSVRSTTRKGHHTRGEEVRRARQERAKNVSTEEDARQVVDLGTDKGRRDVAMIGIIVPRGPSVEADHEVAEAADHHQITDP
jgi:hypothetical protein